MLAMTLDDTVQRTAGGDGLSDIANAALADGIFCCPVHGQVLVRSPDGERLACHAGGHAFPIEAAIPRLFVANEWDDQRRDVTEIVKAFYEETPFPNYDGLDTRASLRAKAGQSLFARMLDQQVPHDARIAEFGCGTGQMTNFLGMGWGRTAIGVDICLNSLSLAKGFRDRFSINNAHFVQANLFRPPFAPASFDLVISNGVLHHTGDCAGAFRAIAALIKPGGFLAVGLYNWLGRLPTLWRRALIERFGQSAAVLDHRLRGQGEAARRQAWYMDQYRHPHETRHSMDELLGWFAEQGFHFTAAIPTIGDASFTEDMPLFAPRSPGTRRQRLASELEMLLTGGQDGGLFIMIGRKGD